MRRVAKIEEPALIVSPQMRPEEKIAGCIERLQRRIFHLILVAGGCGKVWQQKARLCVQAGAVVAVLGRECEVAKLSCWNSVRRVRILRTKREWIGREETLNGIGNQFAVVGFRAAQPMMPVFA